MSKNINLNPKQFKSYGRRIVGFLKKHLPIIFIVSVLSIYGFLIFQINRLSTAEPPPEAIAQQKTTIKRLKVDQEAVDKIKKLEDQNISVQSLFKAARDNPFQDN